jgi:hypothetical protein
MQSLINDNRCSAPSGFTLLDNATRPLGLMARLAVTDRQREDVFALRHKSYLAGGFIDQRPSGLFSDPYDDRPNCQSIIVYRRARPVASVRVCVLDPDPARSGWQDIPALHVFPDEIAGTLAARPAPGGRAIEINRLVRHPDFAADPGLVFVLFHLAGYMILRHGAGIVFSCVRKNHIPFYKRLKFSLIAGPRSYPELKFATSLLGCSRENYQDVQRMMPLLEGQSPDADFANMIEGKTVAVFGRP